MEAHPIGSMHFAEHAPATKSTPYKEIDRSLQILEAHKQEWAQLEIKERLLLMDEARKDLLTVKDLWIHSEVEAKGIPPQTFGVAEEWIQLALVFRAVRQIETTLKNIDGFKPSRDRLDCN